MSTTDCISLKEIYFRGWEPLDGKSWSEYGTEEHPQRGQFLLVAQLFLN